MEVGPLFGILRRRLPPGVEGVERVLQDRPDQIQTPVGQRQRVIGVRDPGGALGDDGAGVEALRHQVSGDTDLGLVVDQRPVRRPEPRILRQQGVVDVERAQTRGVVHVPRDHRRPVRHHHEIRVRPADRLRGGAVEALRLNHRDTALPGESCDILIHPGVVRVVDRRLGAGEDDLVTTVGESGDGAVSEGGEAGENDAHARTDLFPG